MKKSYLLSRTTWQIYVTDYNIYADICCIHTQQCTLLNRSKQQSSLLADVVLMARCCRTMYQEETPEDRAKELQAEREQRRQEQFLVRIAGSNAHRMVPALCHGDCVARTVSTRPWDSPALKDCNGFTLIKRQSRGLLGGTCSCFYSGANGVV